VTFDRGDIFVLPYPFVEVGGRKKRPALLLSSSEMHRVHGVGFAAMITTARGMTDIRPDDIELPDIETLGLRARCVVRMTRIMTVELGDGAERIGRWSKATEKSVVRALRRLLLPGR
jgi:mRNA interferase MazF